MIYVVWCGMLLFLMSPLIVVGVYKKWLWKYHTMEYHEVAIKKNRHYIL